MSKTIKRSNDEISFEAPDRVLTFVRTEGKKRRRFENLQRELKRAQIWDSEREPNGYEAPGY